MAVHHQSIISVWFFLLVICYHCPSFSYAQLCSDLTLLERDLFQSGQNRYQLTKTFFPPRNAYPVFVTVNYTFEDSNTTRLWYWSESEFYLIQPLEIFQFSSLFFSNLPHRQASLSLTLPRYCSDASDEIMEVLTQRLKLYAQPTVRFPPLQSTPARITEAYTAVAASREEIVADAFQTNFVKAWFHIAVVLFPIFTGVLVCICDPVHLLLGDKTWQKLEDEHNHPTVAALIQISVELTVFVFIVDVFGFINTLGSNTIIGSGNSSFYLSLVTGVIIDVAMFVWVMFVLVVSCHWDCRKLWYRWRNMSCPRESSKRIKKLMCSTMIAPVICITNHCHYIILAFISDPFHAGSIGIAYGLSFFLHYFIFRQFYVLVASRSSAKPKPNLQENLESNKMAHVDVHRVDSTKPLQGQSAKRRPRVALFRTEIVTIGLMFIAPLLIFYEGLIIALFVELPITKTVEDAPSRLYTIYQGTGILIVALLTYNIILHPNPFSLVKSINVVGRELHLPDKVANWCRLSDEEKFASIVTTLCLSKYEKESKEKDEVKTDVDGKPMSVSGIVDEPKETTL